MRSLLVPALFALLVPHLVACGGSDGDNDGFPKPQCHDGIDNDGDGDIDFPQDLGCFGETDDSEDSVASPQCKDGRDNDGDGKIDFPTDPGCFAPNQDDESDDCPDGPACPQCSNGKDDDGNGQTDWPSDSLGCESASDTDEYTRNLVACGSNVMIKRLPFDGHVMGGTLNNSGFSNLTSPMCGGAGIEDVWELRVTSPKVIVASTDSGLTSADTVLYIRSSDCQNNANELVCNDNVSTTNKASTITTSISTPGTYYLVVDSKDSTVQGSYDLTVKFLTGEGEPCSGADDCGPGLVCRIPFGGTQKVCSKHVCEDGADNDGDGKMDYPNDPGCLSKVDDDETDGCPGVGPSCPECGDGVDNDGDGKIDYAVNNGDPTCTSAADASEACVSTDGVSAITTAMTTGDTTGAVNDVKPSCGSSTATAPDRTYRLDLPGMATLSLNLTASFDTVTALYNSTCGGTAVSCSDPLNMTVTNVAAGTYYFVVDGYSTAFGPYTINVSGKIQNGQSCESVLAQSGAITCNIGYACKGTMGSRTCQPALCADGLDNDGDGKIDYPYDPGCVDTADDTEQDPATPPVCADGMDNDGDMLTDFPADYGCAAASGTSEVFCMGEMDATAAITTKTTTGTTTAASNDWAPSCQTSSSASDKVYALPLPVPVATLTVDTIGSSFDTVLSIRNAQCTAEIPNGCNDDGGGSLTSKIDLTNVAPGNYAIIVDAYQSNNGPFTLNVRGTVAPQTSCTSPLFSGGANAVLVCPTGTTCMGTPAKCQ